MVANRLRFVSIPKPAGGSKPMTPDQTPMTPDQIP
jgi:hypothetical protein